MTTCSTCRFYLLTDALQGLCRRYPPVAAIVVVPTQHPITRQTALLPQSMSTSTATPSDGWCGEWAEAPPRLQLA